MQRKTFESNRDMAVIAVTYEAGIFLSGRKRRGNETNCNIVGKAYFTNNWRMRGNY